jgi:hypothetical protein
VHCSSLREVAATNVSEVENLVGIGNLAEVVSSGHASSGGETDGFADNGASDNENSWMYCFGASTITLVVLGKWRRKGILSMAKRESRGRNSAGA